MLTSPKFPVLEDKTSKVRKKGLQKMEECKGDYNRINRLNHGRKSVSFIYGKEGMYCLLNNLIAFHNEKG